MEGEILSGEEHSLGGLLTCKSRDLRQADQGLNLSHKQVLLLYIIFPSSSAGKEPACKAGDPSWIPGLGGCPGGGHGNASILAWRIPVGRGVWRAIVHAVAKSQMLLSN